MSANARGPTILRCLLGPQGDARRAVAAYEADFAAHFGGDGDAIAFDHGRTALRALLDAFGLQRGDEVVLSAYTCHSVPRTLRALGLTPVFVDIDPAHYGPSVESARSALTPRTRAILVQHSYGWPADVIAIAALAEPRGIRVIEDCCQTLGARIGGLLVGTIGDAAFYSMQWNKPFSTGQGGMAVVRDAAAAQRMRAWRDSASIPIGMIGCKILATELLAFELLMYPRSAALLTGAFRTLSRLLPMPGGTDAVEASRERPVLEAPRALTALQAALGCVEVARWDQTAAQRGALAKRLRSALAGMGYSVPHDPPDGMISPLRLPVRVRDPLAMIAAARGYGFELTSWFDVPLDALAAFRPEPAYVLGSCPRAERAAREVVLVPLGRRVTARVADRIESLFCAQREAQVL